MKTTNKPKETKISILSKNENWVVDCNILCEDIMFVMQDYFRCNMTKRRKGLLLQFENGQKFEIAVKECN